MNSDSDTLTFYGWKELFLQKRSLKSPDKRPLYRYHVTEEEFLDLEQFVRGKVEKLLPHGLAHVASRRGFADLFVLYGAEWWRRRYDGSGFSWDPILRNIGIHADDWKQGQRSECVQRGLESWNLRLTATGGFRFLGAVAVQGGLPMLLLAEARGGIGHLISRVLRIARTSSVSLPDLQGWVESLETMLPKSFRQPAIFALLTNVAWTVLDLKDKAELTAGTDSIARLDHLVPNWRNRFPLPIEDTHAQQLIDQLVREAATIRTERESLLLPLQRTLEIGDNVDWVIKSALDLPETIEAKHISKLFDIKEDDLPRLAELILVAGEESRRAGLRKMTGHDSYRVARNLWAFSGKLACDEHLIQLKAQDGRAWRAAATKGQALDFHLPWVFSGDNEIPRLLRQGSGPIADKKGVITIPGDWNIASEDGGIIESLGRISEFERNIFSIQGNCIIFDATGNRYLIRTGDAGAREESYEWVGNRQWSGFKNPSIAFKGRPSLFIVDEDGVKRRINGEVGCAVIGSPTSQRLYGPVYLRYPAAGEIKYRTRMVVLPESSSLKLLPDDSRSGVIFFEDWGLKDARVDSDRVKSRFVSNDGNGLLELSVLEGNRAPDEVEILALWPHTTTQVKLLLPFPAKGIRAFARDGQEIQSRQRLAVQQLIGTRIAIIGANQYSRILLKLTAADKNISRKYEIKNVEALLSLELRIADYRSDIEQLLTIDDNPDSTVNLDLELGDQSAFNLEITPYAFRPERDASQIWVDFGSSAQQPEVPEKAPQALALRLESPGEEALSLPFVDSPDDNVTRWSFTPEDRDPGAWLVFPPLESAYYFRPTLWTVPGETHHTDSYRAAIATRNETERRAALDKLIGELATDFLHPNWLEVEQLANQIGHLPLATLDIWKRFARSSKGMAAIALRFSGLTAPFLYRFAQELPFAWETIAYRDWYNAIAQAKSQCKVMFDEDVCDSVLKSFLDSRTTDLVAETGSLHYILGILKAEYTHDAREDVAALRIGGQYFEAFLFTGEFSPLNKLRQRHYSDTEEWPSELWETVMAGINDPSLRNYLYPDRLGFQDSVIDVPLLLAAEVSRSRTTEWFADPKKIHMLRFYRAFDPDWFDDAFNQTIARCLADGLLD